MLPIQDPEPVAHTVLDALGVFIAVLSGVLAVIWAELVNVRKRVHELVQVTAPLKTEVQLLQQTLDRFAKSAGRWFTNP